MIALIVNRYEALPATVKGSLLILIATMAFSAMHTIIRYTGESLHPFEIAFFRNFFGSIVILPWLLKHGLGVFRTQRLGTHAVRGVLQIAAMLCFFTGLTMAPLAEVSALSFAAPLFASIGAVLFLGEKMRIRRTSALIIGFLGVLIIVQPGFEEVTLGTVLVLSASAIWSIAMLLVKSMSRTDSSITITAYMSVFLSVLSFFPALYVWTWPTYEELGWMVVMGCFGTAAHIAMAQAFKEADATAILPIDFTRLIWASVLGYLVFTEIPDIWTWIGGLVIFSSTTYIAFREARIKKVPVPPSVPTAPPS